MDQVDKASIERTTHRVKDFFRQRKWPEIFIFLFFVLLSAGFWYLQSLQQEYETEIVIPVKYRNLPDDIMLTGEHPQEVTAKVRDKGIVLLNYSWLNSFAPIEINLKKLFGESGEQPVVARKVIESEISKQLMATTQLLHFEPSSIAINYTGLQSAVLPVIADVSVGFEPGFQVSDALAIDPAKVQVYATKAVLDTLKAIHTVSWTLKKVNKTQEVTLELKKISGVRTEPREVKVRIPVEEYTEKRLTIPVVCGTSPRNVTLRLFPASVEVVCNIPISRFKDLTESDFEIQVAYREFEKNKEQGRIFLALTRKPQWVENPVLIPDSIEFIIEQHP
ncbi:MAG: YbbR-like domain-containing protein [Tannerella sp.]|jgi:hypothetical protein|nr:YbbR-like domain-containing protein [Tannerella sp.]